ncbi:MAG: MGMT family protein, partial [Elusimicrobiales bacterium]|nr:MGMT family protein [Elusimicrobiales bacterium]
MKLNKKIIQQIKKYPSFYQKVWKLCIKIPKGQVRSYKWIAKKLGNPRAARAVALALKKNPFAPIIPCHRVIRSDGRIGGYSGAGGIKKKKELLKKEGYS